jgi:hypothetical protein
LTSEGGGVRSDKKRTRSRQRKYRGEGDLSHLLDPNDLAMEEPNFSNEDNVSQHIQYKSTGL